MGETGGIVKADSPIYACKVQLVCPKCKKPTRVGHKVAEDGKKERLCKKCGATF
jgi:large subunit ribosomal protein L24